MIGAADLRALSDELRLDSQNPWPGLTAFTEKQHEFFYGREQESHELFSCVKRERLTVLFGKSGLGKTSLLQAGLFPQLRAADCLPVYVRLSYEDHAAPFDTQLRSALGSAIESANFAEVAFPQEGETVWEYLHRRGGNLINDEGNVVMPVLIFDQFEECFTLGARKDFSSRLTHEFLPGLAEMIENRTPAALTKKLTDDRDLAKRYDLEAHGCRILITLREDYLANLEALRDSMPSLVYIDNRMRLTEMTGEQALSVVVDPSPALVAPDVAESIVRFVAGAHTDSADGDVRTVDSLPLKQLEVAPAILSLFCSQLNEERLKTPGMSKITRALVLSQGVTIIEDFYKKCIAGMHPAVRRLIEDRLLTTAGYRDNIDLAEARSTLESAGARSSYIDELVRLRLLQIEDHRGVARLELTHDVLAEPVKHSRDDWKKEQQHEAAQQQEREALLRAKEAEQEALKRTRFLQRMVGAAAFVCLLLASVVVYGYFERREAISNAERAERNREALVQSNQAMAAKTFEAVQLAGIARQETDLANRNEAKAEDNAKKFQESTLVAEESAQAEKESRLEALGMQKQMSGISNDVLRHCVIIYDEFNDAAKKVNDNAGKDAIRTLYEHLLMDKSQCLDLAKEAHRMEPQDIDVSDSLTNIPLHAAASAAVRHDPPEIIKSQVMKDFNIALDMPIFKDESNKDVVQIELARVYLSFADVLGYIHDNDSQATAEKGLKIIANLRAQGRMNTWDYYDWDILAEAENWYSLYCQDQDRNKEAIKVLISAFDDEKRAADLAPKEKPYYAGEALYRAQRIADTERDLGNDDAAEIHWYEVALALAKQQDNKNKITQIYTSLRLVLAKDKKYDEALAQLNPRIQSLLTTPQSMQRDRDLAQAYRDAAEVEEARKNYAQGYIDREQVQKLLEAMKPNAYEGQPGDLIAASTLVAWDEIYIGQVDQGIKDTQKAIELSERTEGHPDLANSYANGVNALNNNKHYDEALKLANQRIRSLLASPKTTQRQRDLVKIYKLAAQVEESRSEWAPAIAYRAKVVEVLTALNPDDYSDERSDFINAYSLLSYDEIYVGQVDKGIADAQTAISLSNQTEGHPELSDSYDNVVKALAYNKLYDEAQRFIAQRLQAIASTPKSIKRQRDLAGVYKSAADIEETRKQWVRGAEYRARAIEALSSLKPSDYDDQRSDLLFAYSFLSWDEIFAGQTTAGIADAENAIRLSLKTDSQTSLYSVYENGVNALMQNSKYEQAGALLAEFDQTLSASPAGPLREREFATVVDVDMARLAEVRKQWALAVTYRLDEVKRLLALDPNAYETLKADLVSAYGGLSFEEEEAGNFAEGVEAAKAGLKLDPSQSWIEENEANGLLLGGHPADAKALYMKVKDVQWQGAPMLAAISDDLHTFCTLGYARPEMTEIAHELGIKNDELYACLAASSQRAPSH
jgi:hypothetical protein